jgi:hypothetical protein
MTLSLILSSIDGNWVDIGSFITGFVYIIWLRCRGSRTVPFLSKNTAFDFANGLSVFPLILLTLSPIASVLMKGLVDASKISLGVAGVFSLFAILEDGTSSKKVRPS